MLRAIRRTKLRAPASVFSPRARQGSELTLAVDPTAKGGDLVALVVSVTCRGLAIPVAWHIKIGGQPGPLIRVGKACPEVKN